MSHRITNWAKRLFHPKPKKAASQPANIVPRAQHCISRDNISSNALKVLYRLKDAGFSAFLVGGGVRDLLLKRSPKDFDVATDAHPEQVRDLFRNSRIIGRRFRLVHVFYGDENIEVSTFRANVIEQTRPYAQKDTETGMIFRDNAYGTIEEDAWRRDFTINALYYNISDFSVVDYMNGMEDIKNRLLRMIGDPSQRFHEDPVRMLRAIRLSAKLDLDIESAMESVLIALPNLLKHVPPPRLFDECLKLFFEGNAFVTYQKLVHYRYMDALFPQTMHALRSSFHHHINEKLIMQALHATDQRLQNNDSVNPGFLLAVFLWPVLRARIEKIKNKKNKFYLQLHQIIHDVMRTQLQSVMIPKRLQFIMQTIWMQQFYLEKRRKSRVLTVFSNRYFRAAFDFMALRVTSGEITSEIYDWWKAFQFSDEAAQAKMIDQL